MARFVNTEAVARRDSVFRIVSGPESIIARLRAAYPGLQEFMPLPGRVFTDTAATTPAAFGQGVGGLRDGARAVRATQGTSDARPVYGRHPASGLRNLLGESDTLATQSRTVTAAQHTLSFRGTGTVTLSGASTSGPLVGTGAGDVVSLTFTPSAGSLTLTVSGTVEVAQLELGAARTAYQSVADAGGFDVTEAGQRSVYYLRPDGSDDWMEFATAFQPAGAYTLAGSMFRGVNARHDLFGLGASANNRAIIAAGGSFTIQSASSANSRAWLSAVGENTRSVVVARVPGTTGEKLFVNGTDRGTPDTVSGDIFPFNASGFTSLFRSGLTFFATGRFYGGVLIPGAITEVERLALQRYLGTAAGFGIMPPPGEGDWEII
jgi:hypothetical protein